MSDDGDAGGEASSAAPFSGRETAVALWGAGGVLLLLSQALYRLTPLALEPLAMGTMTRLQWGLYLGWTLFNCYAEGYRGFQKAFCPRVVARALHLARHPKPAHVVLAPLFCMGFFHASRRRKIVSWSVTLGIVALVIAVRQVAQPWRGIIDAGVVVGLGWGLIAIAVFLIRGLRGAPLSAPIDLPDPPEGSRRG